MTRHCKCHLIVKVNNKKQTRNIFVLFIFFLFRKKMSYGRGRSYVTHARTPLAGVELAAFTSLAYGNKHHC